MGINHNIVEHVKTVQVQLLCIWHMSASILPLIAQDRESHLKMKESVVHVDGEKIHALIKENLEHFAAAEDSEDWKNYVDYLDDVVLDGFFECMHCSLHYLMDNMNKMASPRQVLPLMEAKLELQVRKTKQI